MSTTVPPDPASAGQNAEPSYTPPVFVRQAITAIRPDRKGNAMKFNKGIPAVAALGLAGFFGVAACSAAAPTPPPPATQPPSTTTPQPQPTQTSPSPQEVAQAVADIAVGNGGLTALEGGDGQASSANCDPSTVSNPPDVSTPTSASCDITYSDGSVWQQTVTITFDSQGNPLADSTNVGTELTQPATG